MSTGEYTLDANPKCKKIGKVIVGGAGDAAPIDVFMLMDNTICNLYDAKDPFRYVVSIILPAWRKILVELNTINTESSSEGPESDVFMAIGGKCFSIRLQGNGTLNALEHSLPTSFGCGGLLAIAALKGITSKEINLNMYYTRRSLEQALKITATLNSACDDNVDILTE